MKTRKTARKSAPGQKTSPGTKSLAETTPNPPESATESTAPEAAASKTKQANEKADSAPSLIDSKPDEISAVESTLAIQAASSQKTSAGSVSNLIAGKTRTLAYARKPSSQIPKFTESLKTIDVSKDNEVAEAKDAKIDEEDLLFKNFGQTAEKEKSLMELGKSSIEIVGDSSREEKVMMETEMNPISDFHNAFKQGNVVIGKSLQDKISFNMKIEEVEEDPEEEEEAKDVEKKETSLRSIHFKENVKEHLRGQEIQPAFGEHSINVVSEDYSDKVDLGEHGEEEPGQDDVENPTTETATLEEERRELSAMAKERKNKKEHEIFVGGLDRDAAEEDVRKAFERIGEVLEVRLHKNSSTNKNKGYAFVKFANKEHARRALEEMKNPVICGKRCGTAPSEDNDTLFLGNICNTWTKEAIKKKLKDYGIEGLENITLVSDVQHEGLSRGFAFLEFSCHVDAMLAYKRLQKPDVIFGHPERTAKVAFAEPLSEPDPEIMAQVKSVFVDGIPAHWDEERVREQFKGYGEIVRIVLARNMSTSKRKDFGFVDFSTHEEAVAFIDGINNKELTDGNLKIKIKARLLNPLPKTQAVKGGMCGGFRIGNRGGGAFSRFGRGFGRGQHSFNHGNYQRGRGFYEGGRGQSGRTCFRNDFNFDYPYSEFDGRNYYGRGGSRGPFRGAYHNAGRGVAFPGPSGPMLDEPWYGAPDRAYDFSARRRPFSPGRHFDGPFDGWHFDDPYLYEDNPHGMKRPFSMMHHSLDYMEPVRYRPRLDYSETPPAYRGNYCTDTYGSSNSPYPHDYYDPEFGGPDSSFYEGSSYGGGYYY